VQDREAMVHRTVNYDDWKVDSAGRYRAGFQGAVGFSSFSIPFLPLILQLLLSTDEESRHSRVPVPLKPEGLHASAGWLVI